MSTAHTAPPHHPYLDRILTQVAAELAPLLAAGHTARLTLNVSAGGGVRLEVTRFVDIAAAGDVQRVQRDGRERREDSGSRRNA